MLGARHAESHGTANLVYSVLQTGEELMEIVGIALFLYALLRYASRQFHYLRISFND